MVMGIKCYGQFGLNHDPKQSSSPVQVPGTTWSEINFRYL